MIKKRLFVVSVGLFIGWSLSSLYNGPLNNILFPYQNNNYLSIFLFVVPLIPFLLLNKLKLIKYTKALLPFSIGICLVGYLFIVTNYLFGSTLMRSGIYYAVICIIGISMMYFIGCAIIMQRNLFDFTYSTQFMAYILLLSYGVLSVTWVLLSFKLVTLSIVFSIVVLSSSLILAIFLSYNQKSTLSERHKPNKSIRIHIFFIIIFLLNLGDGILLALLNRNYLFGQYNSIFLTVIPYVILPIIYLIAYKRFTNSFFWISLGAGLIIIGFILYNFSPILIIISVLGLVLSDIILWGIGLMLNAVYKRSFLLVACTIGSNSLAVFIGYVSAYNAFGSIGILSVCFSVSAIACVIGILLIPLLYKEIVVECEKTLEHQGNLEKSVEDIKHLASKFSLTKREMDIFVLLINNLTYNQISSATNISLNTVKTHIKHIYLKFDVSSKKNLINKVSVLMD